MFPGFGLVGVDDDVCNCDLPSSYLMKPHLRRRRIPPPRPQVGGFDGVSDLRRASLSRPCAAIHQPPCAGYVSMLVS